MMIWDKYRKEVEHINAEDTFQNKLIHTLHTQQNKQTKHIRFTLRYAMTCMVLCVCIISVVIGLYKPTSHVNKETKDEKVSANLPKITVDLKQSGGMGGMVSFVALDPKEDFKTNNPIKANTKLKTLPVYRNGIITDEAGRYVLEGGLSDEEQQVLLDKYKTLFQFKKVQRDLSGSNGLYHIYSEGCISVDRDGAIRIQRNVTNKIAKKFQKDVTTQKQAQKMALQFANTYKSQLSLKKPLPDIAISYSTLPNSKNELEIVEKKYAYSVYEKESTLQKRIDSYNFRRIEFYFFEGLVHPNGELSPHTIYIHIYNDLKGELIGNYPVISRKEAKEQFHKGKYFSNSPDPKENGEIVYMDLIYQYTKESEYIVPFYRIYAPAKDEIYNPLKEGMFYGMYYVPAIPECYIKTEDLKNNVKFYG